MLSRQLLSVAAFGLSLLASHRGVHATFPDNINIVEPKFQAVYDATVLLSPNPTQFFVPGPFGDRAFIGVLGGNLTNSTTGELEAEILPGVGGEFGIISTSNGKFYVDVSLALQWTDDKTYAYVSEHGIGSIGTNFTSGAAYARMETNSTSRQDIAESVLLSSIVILTGSSTPDGTIGYFRIFEKISPDPTVSN